MGLIDESKRIARAFSYSMSGIRLAFKADASFRCEVFLALILFPTVFLLPLDWIYKLLVMQSMFLVLVTELLNIGIENVVDYISKERHPIAKLIKDAGSAAVFFALINCLFFWIYALLQL